VEARYQAYRQRLEREFDKLGPRLQAEAPDLHPKLKAATPEPVPYSYRILPKMIADLAPSVQPPRSTSISYSWRRTDALIDGALKRLEALEAKVDAVPGTPPEARRAAWEQIVNDYVGLAQSHRLINDHVQYNRLWQGEIERHRAGYDYMTTLHDAVLERQGILDAIRAADPNLDPRVHAREQELLRQIRQRTDVLTVPAFLRVEEPAPRRWTIRVPVYTDIDDTAFLRTFRSAVENAWHVQDGGDEFQVVLDIRHVPSSRLYPDGRVPAHGEHIDRFPPDGAVLTTGANTTHVLGRAINLGPHDIAPNTLAHEFGHILGFVDGYFRGYRDRGPEGYEVLEVLTDPSDIMSAPGIGRVQRRHFQRILDTRRGPARVDPGAARSTRKEQPDPYRVKYAGARPVPMSNRAQNRVNQALRDLAPAADSRKAERHEWACYAAQQDVEKAVKALHLHVGQEAWGHVVATLLVELPPGDSAATGPSREGSRPGQLPYPGALSQ